MTTSPDPDDERPPRRRQTLLAPRVRRTFVVFGVLVAVLLALALPQVLSIRSEVDDLQARWAPVASAANALSSALVDQESAERGYVITGVQSFLAPYRRAEPVVARSFRHLQRQLRDDERGAAILAHVRSRYDRWRAMTAEPQIRLVEQGQREAAAAQVANGDGEQLFARVRDAQDALVRYSVSKTRNAAESIRNADERLLVELLVAAGAILVILLTARMVFGRWAARLDRQREVESRLAEQTELLLRVTNTTSDPIFLKDEEGRYVFLNDGTAAALGGDSAEAYWGRHDADLFDADELPAIYRDDAAVRGSAHPLVFEEQVGGRLYEVTKAAFRFADGRLGVLGIGRDVTTRNIERDRLAAVAMVTRAVAIHESVDDVGSAVRDVLAAATGADVIWVLVADLERDGLRAVLKDGTHVPTERDWQYLAADAPTFTAEAYRSREVRVVHVEDVDPDRMSSAVFENEQLATVAYLPFPTSSSAGGVVNLGWRTHREPSADELAFYSSLVAILAEGVARAQSTELERLAVHAFQRSLLPTTFPPAVQVAVRYEPALALEVGGDWYDVFSLPDGRVGLAVGDVIGHGVDAAAQMGQLRSVLRAAATRVQDPGAVLDELDRFASAGHSSLAATVSYAILDLERRELEYSCAGHPPPLLVAGGASYLDQARSAPVGFGLVPDEARPSATATLAPEAVVVMYTDGLIEQRGRDIDEGLAALAAATSTASELPIEDLADALLRSLRQEHRFDDAALLCVRVPAEVPRHFSMRIPADPGQLRRVRVDLRAWLEQHALDGDLVDDVVSAVAEASSNAVDHAYQQDRVGQVAIDVVCDDVIRVTVRDRGHWTQPLRRPDRGRGFTIMEGLMDDVVVDTSDDGTTVRLLKRVDGARITG